jgi:SpoVK/Ycf46/Vps4 family AAA+-type ATPase
MASADQIKALIKSYLSQDGDQFYSVAMQVAAHEAKQGHGQFAQELRDMIDAAKSRLAAGQLGAAHSIAKPRGELANLLRVTYPKNRLGEMVLDETATAQLSRIIKEQRLFTRIREHGLSPRRKLLLVGPPGTGKTMTASALAGELGLPLFLVRLDALITKFMGETAAKLRQVFDSVSNVRGVYFFDEFDAIGSHRGMANDVGEIRRVLNSFLQMIEQDHSNSLIVAATNHPNILDYALFRRFDAVIEYHLPDDVQIAHLIRARLGEFLPQRLSIGKLVAKARGLSFAEICRAADEAIKEAVMHEQKQVREPELSRMLQERLRLTMKQAGNKNIRPGHGRTRKR